MPKKAARKRPERKVAGSDSAQPKSILVIDIGGSKIKLLASGQTEPVKFPSGPTMGPTQMVTAVLRTTKNWKFDAVSIGYPGLVGLAGPRSEPGNLAPGWVGFNFAAAFSRPVRILNDAALQALGAYEGGRMLFLGFGTGLGSALISQNSILPLELGSLRYWRNRSYSDVLGRRGLKERGKKYWRRAVAHAVSDFLSAFEVDYVMLGGGNSEEIKDVPPGARIGNNKTALRGGFRLWNLDDLQTLKPDDHAGTIPAAPPAEWRVM